MPERDWISREEVERRFVSKDRYLPVERVVYGLLGLVALGVGTAILKLVLVR